MNETIDSTANYRGHVIILSSLGRILVFVYRTLFVRDSLKDATDMIDEMESAKRN